ncbi:MAG: hypothetical protein ABSB84_05900 [Verrucomicrobiota bacterium]|jgi:hypothetical protein
MENGLSVQDLTALLNKANAEIQADQKQLGILERRITVNVKWRQAIQARIAATQESGEATAYGRKWDNVRNAIKAINKARFSQSDVEAELKRIDPEAQIDRTRLRSTLWTFQEKAELIKQVRKGNNQQPALFEKLPDETNSEANPPRPVPSRLPPPRRTIMQE